MNRTLSYPVRLPNARLRRSHRGSFRPHLVALEDRILPSATTTVFTLDSNNSVLSLSGTLHDQYGTFNIQTQGTNSLTTHYSGPQVVTWDLDAKTISFVQSGSAVAAQINGTWQPAVGGGSGSAPADYGAKVVIKVSIVTVNVYGAIRNLVTAATTSSPLTLTGSGSTYNFNSKEGMLISQGTFDWNAGSYGHGSQSLVGPPNTNNASTQSTFQDLGNGSYKLTLPISISQSATQNGQTINITISGTVVANAAIPFVVLSNGSGGNYNYSTQVTATQGPVHITDPAAKVTDGGTSTISSMTVTLTNHPDGALEYLAGNLNGTGLSGSYNSSTGVFAITGNASTSVYTNVLESLTYENDSNNPNTQARTITVVAKDANNQTSLLRTSTVSVSAPAPATHFVVAGFPSPITAGTAGNVTVTAKDANGNTATGYAGTVHFTSSDGQATLPNDYTFTLADHGVHTFSATLKTAGSQSLTATDKANGTINGSQSGIVVNPAATSAFAVTGFPSPVTAGVSGNFTVTAKDAYGNTTPAYTGTVTFSSSDSQANVPQDYPFLASDNGVHTFPGILYTAGSQSLIALDKANSNINGMQAGIQVNPAAASMLVAANFPSPTVAGTQGMVTVTAEDAYGNTATSYTGTVHFTSSDPKASLPTDYSFTAGDAGVHTFPVTLYTAGPQGIRVQDGGGLIAEDRRIGVDPAAAASVVVAGYPSPVQVGTSNAFSVSVYDAYGNQAAGYTGTVHFTSSDPIAGLPNDYTFTTSDGGTQTFNATFNTVGIQSLTATDTVKPSLTGTQSGIEVDPPPLAAWGPQGVGVTSDPATVNVPTDGAPAAVAASVPAVVSQPATTPSPEPVAATVALDNLYVALPSDGLLDPFVGNI